MTRAAVIPSSTPLEGLSLARKREMLEGLLRQESGPILAPCTSGQQAQWLYEQVSPGTAAYNEAFADRLRGKLDSELLRQAIESLVRRHPALRTTFKVVGGEPMQRIATEAPTSIRRVDLEAVAAAEQGSRVDSLLAEESQQPFDLEQGPLMRFLLIRLGPVEHILLQTVHHIVFDVWSRSIFLRELSQVYDGLLAGKAVELPILATTYGDYARWQRRRLSGQALQRHLRYWRQRLQTAPPRLELPTDFPRPAVQSSGGAKCVRVLPHALVEDLRRLGKRESATLFMVFLTAFKVLLHRLGGATDVVIGTALAGRDRAEIEGLVGFFVNLLALRTDLSGDPTYRELLGRLRGGLLRDLEHQSLPFDRLVEEISTQRDLSQKPIFQVVFDFLEGSHRPASPEGIETESLQVERGIAIFDLLIVVVEQPAGWELTLQYSTDLFTASRMERLLEQYENLLRDVAANPGGRLSELRILSTKERRRLLDRWNDSGRELVDPRPVQERFLEWARRAPEGLAIADAEGEMTYGQLERQSRRLAGWLQSKGVGPEVRVGLLLERSPESIVAMLAVLRAGGAYVPLDPEHPSERLRRMIEDAGCACVLSLKDLAERLPGVPGAESLWLEDAPEEGRPVAALAPPPYHPKNLAYVIFTSGSTGRPRGVAIPHAGLLNLVDWHCSTYDLEAKDRAPWIASATFDASVWEIWPYLSSGASLHLPSREQRTVPEALWAWLSRQGISLAFLPTPLAAAALAELAQRPALAEGLSIRALLTGGDRLHEGAPAGSPFRLFNHYGPTEVSVVSTMAPVSPGAAAPPIGRSIANLRTYVLDAALGVLPVGVPGELAIGGEGLARGYLGHPRASAERFVPNPFGQPGERLYRSGDRVQWSEQGQLEFLGRADHQVKLRGCRIELGEIEAGLRSHPAVREAVAVSSRDSGQDRLVAYAVLEVAAEPRVSGTDLRQHLRSLLPDYMLPASIEILPQLPRGSSGKVDRFALPSPGLSQRDAETEFVQPHGELERLLAVSWCQVLEIDRVGAYDNFFDLGGHSLQLVELHQLLEKSLEHPLSVVDLFNFPSITALAGHLRGSEPGAAAEQRSGLSRQGGLEKGMNRLKDQRKRQAVERGAQGASRS